MRRFYVLDNKLFTGESPWFERGEPNAIAFDTEPEAREYLRAQLSQTPCQYLAYNGNVLEGEIVNGWWRTRGDGQALGVVFPKNVFDNKPDAIARAAIQRSEYHAQQAERGRRRKWHRDDFHISELMSAADACPDSDFSDIDFNTEEK